MKYLSTARTAIGITATLAIAALSTRFIEQPLTAAERTPADSAHVPERRQQIRDGGTASCT